VALYLRSWFAFCGVLAVVLAVLVLLLGFQHAAVLSELTRNRLSVLAQTTGEAFAPMVGLGLPLSMLRNGDAIVARPGQTDPDIRAVHVVEPGAGCCSAASSRSLRSSTRVSVRRCGSPTASSGASRPRRIW
jgi:hypothetical protein